MQSLNAERERERDTMEEWINFRMHLGTSGFLKIRVVCLSTSCNFLQLYPDGRMVQDPFLDLSSAILRADLTL